MIDFNIILFDDFETLDAFGPVEIIGEMTEIYELNYYSINGGIITGSQNIRIDTLPIKKMDTKGVLLIPGGKGTRAIINDTEFIYQITDAAQNAKFVLTVCTGSALLAKTGLLNGKQATSNKRAFDWVQSVNPKISWIKEARWVVDDKFYTSSGVSAGIDMTLGFIKDTEGNFAAENIARAIEYIWNDDKTFDPFAI